MNDAGALSHRFNLTLILFAVCFSCRSLHQSAKQMHSHGDSIERAALGDGSCNASYMAFLLLDSLIHEINQYGSNEGNVCYSTIRCGAITLKKVFLNLGETQSTSMQTHRR